MHHFVDFKLDGKLYNFFEKQKIAFLNSVMFWVAAYWWLINTPCIINDFLIYLT